MPRGLFIFSLPTIRMKQGLLVLRGNPRQFIGSPEHLGVSQRFGFTSRELPPHVP
jgi:hypothetical protein